MSPVKTSRLSRRSASCGRWSLPAPLGLAGELRQRDDRDLQLLGELLQAAADGGDLEVAVLVACRRPASAAGSRGSTSASPFSAFRRRAFEATSSSVGLGESSMKSGASPMRAHRLDDPRPLLLRQVAASAGGRTRCPPPSRGCAAPAPAGSSPARRSPTVLLLADRHVLGDVEREAGLAHARPAGDDDQVAAVEAVGDAVEVDEAGGHADERRCRGAPRGPPASRGRPAPSGTKPRWIASSPSPRIACSARPRAPVASRPPSRQSRMIRPRGLDQPPADRALLDDLDVGVDAAEVGQVEVEAGEVGEAADAVELPLLLELGLQGAQVDLGAARPAGRASPGRGAGGARGRSPRRAAARRCVGSTRGSSRTRGEHRPLRLLAVRQRLSVREGCRSSGTENSASGQPHRSRVASPVKTRNGAAPWHLRAVAADALLTGRIPRRSDGTGTRRSVDPLRPQILNEPQQAFIGAFSCNSAVRRILEGRPSDSSAKRPGRGSPQTTRSSCAALIQRT